MTAAQLLRRIWILRQRESARAVLRRASSPPVAAHSASLDLSSVSSSSVLASFALCPLCVRCPRLVILPASLRLPSFRVWGSFSQPLPPHWSSAPHACVLPGVAGLQSISWSTSRGLTIASALSVCLYWALLEIVLPHRVATSWTIWEQVPRPPPRAAVCPRDDHRIYRTSLCAVDLGCSFESNEGCVAGKHTHSHDLEYHNR